MAVCRRGDFGLISAVNQAVWQMPQHIDHFVAAKLDDQLFILGADAFEGSDVGK